MNRIYSVFFNQLTKRNFICYILPKVWNCTNLYKTVKSVQDVTVKASPCRHAFNSLIRSDQNTYESVFITSLPDVQHYRDRERTSSIVVSSGMALNVIPLPLSG